MLLASAAPAAADDGAVLLRAYRQAGALRERAPGLFAGAPGIVVVAVQPEAPAAGLGISVGDVWLRYRGESIASVESFLEQRAEPGDSGPLEFLRGRDRLQILLPAGRLGAGLVDLAPLDLAAGDAGLFFDFLAAGMNGKLDVARGLIRQHRDAFERVRQVFAGGGGPDAAGAGQLAAWAESLEVLLDADARRQAAEARLEQLASRRAELDRQLEEIRAARADLQQRQRLLEHAERAERAMSAGDISTAWREWDDARLLAGGLRLPVAEVVAIANMSGVAATQGDPGRARKLAEMAVARAGLVEMEQAVGANDPLLTELSGALNKVGDVQHAAGRYRQADEAYALAVDLATGPGAPDQRFSALMNRSNALQSAGDLAEAERMAEAARAIAQSDRPGSAETCSLRQARALLYELLALSQLGQVQAAAGDRATAIATVEQALAAGKRLRALPLDDTGPQAQYLIAPMRAQADQAEGLSLRQLAMMWDLEGRHSRALQVYRQLLEWAERNDDPNTRFDAQESIAHQLVLLGWPLEALDVLQDLLKSADLDDGRYQRHRVEMDLASLFMNLGNFDHAIEHANEALETARRFPHRIERGRALAPERKTWFAEREWMALETLAWCQILAGKDPAEARRAIADAAGFAAEFLVGTPKELDWLSAVGGMEALAGEHELASRHLRRALASLRAERNPVLELPQAQLEVSLLGMLAEVAITARGFEEAQGYIEEAEGVLAEHDDPFGRNAIREAKARAALLQDDPATAGALLRENLAFLEDARQRLSASELAQVSFSDAYSTNAELMIWALVRQGKDAEALVVAEQQRGRALADRFRKDAPAAAEGAALDAGDIAGVAAEHNATLVVYHLLYDPEAPLLPGRFGGQQPRDEAELLIWVARPDGSTPVLRRVDLARMRADLGWSLGELVLGQRSAPAADAQSRGSLELPAPIVSPAKSSLYAWLIAPIADLLPPPGRQIVFVPQASLLLTPFASVADPEGKVLVDRHPVSVAPSVKLLRLTRGLAAAHRTRPIADRMADALIVGDPAIEGHDGLPRLKEAEEEAREIVSIWHAPEPLVGEAATEPAVRARIRQASLLHFAAHTSLDYGGDGDLPGAILLAPGAGTERGEGADGLLASSEIMDLQLQAELAVLSACRTGGGRVTGDGVMGLAYAFMRAGVPSLVVSLWDVPDAATAKLMIAFHRALKAGENKAEALRQAMAVARDSGFDDPEEWSGFVLLGQW